MKYYILKNNGLDLKETGTEFQSIDGIVGDIQEEFIPNEGLINIKFQLPEPFLDKKAKQTTYLNVVMIPSWFLILKNYFIEFLKDFNIDNYQTWNIRVHNNNEIINDYSMFYLVKSLGLEVIDFNSSTFCYAIWKDPFYKGNQIKFSSVTDYLNTLSIIENEGKYIKPIKLSLNLSFEKRDLIKISKIPLIGGFYIISENLKNKILEKNFSGMFFQDFSEFDSRIEVKY